MKASTESLINIAMEHNTDIQADNLTMLEICNNLCKRAKTIDRLTRLEEYIIKNKIDKCALEFLDTAIDFSNLLNIDKESFVNLSKEDQSALALNKIAAYEKDERYKISDAIFTMLEASCKDVDNNVRFDKVNSIKNNNLIIYSKEAIDNITESLKHIIQVVSFEHNCNSSYEGFVNKLINKVDEPMSIVHTKITKEGFVSIDIPQPRYQSLREASIESINDVDYISNSLSRLTYKEMNKRIYDLKMSMASRVNNSNNLEDTIKYAHVISQIIMSVKNSIKLMQNYHKASINELN